MTPPSRVLVFGGGKFIRGFIGPIFERYNQEFRKAPLGLVIVKVREQGSYANWKNQDGLYHHFTKGFSNGNQVNNHKLITCVSEIVQVQNEYEVFLASAENRELNIIISNTTEEGIAFDPKDKDRLIPKTFPGQLTRWLERRYRKLGEEDFSRCILLPCELIENNGELLEDVVLQYVAMWKLGNAFADWLAEYCTFCNTLVDRIVPGVPYINKSKYQKAIGYRDLLMTEGEPYLLWAIQALQGLKKPPPINEIGLNIQYVENLSSIKTLKVRILNGAHTAMVAVGLLFLLETVEDVMNQSLVRSFIEKLIFTEIIPTLNEDADTCKEFALQTLERFRNPFVAHKLGDISLYSISKFNNRLKPSLKRYITLHDEIPDGLSFAFCCLIIFYREHLHDYTFSTRDKEENKSMIQKFWNTNLNAGEISIESVQKLLANEKLWEEDLNQLHGFANKVKEVIEEMLDKGVETCLKARGLK